MENKRIEAVKDWPEPQSIWDIQVFLGFANFYWCFIQGINQIAAPLTLMLKTIEVELSAEDLGSVSEGSTVDEVDGDSCHNS